MRHFNTRVLLLILGESLAASVSLGVAQTQQSPQPTITSVQGSFVETTSPMATSVTAGVTNLALTVNGTNFLPPTDGGLESLLVWVPSAGACPVQSCVFQVYAVSSTQLVVSIPDAVIANADPGASVVVRNPRGYDSAPFSFPVNPPVTNAALPQAYLGVPYAAYLTSGGTPGYTANRPTGGAPGLSPSDSAFGGGKLMGAASQLGSFSGTALILDAWGQTSSSNAYSVTVGALPLAEQGVPYALQSSFVGAGQYLLTRTSGSLPPGISLVLSGQSLSIAGTPTAAGDYSAAIRIDSPTGASVAMGTISIKVWAPVAIVTPSLDLMDAGGPYSAKLAAQGGVPPYTWSVSSGSLPAGLSLNSATGVIDGAPTGNGSSFTIKVTDGMGLSSSRTYTLHYRLQIPPATLPAGQVGVNYIQYLSVTGGTGSFNCSVIQGTVPPGLYMNFLCELGGPPSKAGSFTFTVQALDQGDGQVATQQYTVVINSATLAITTAMPLPDTPMGAISIPFAATGGTLPYKWSITAGSLPAGVSLSTAGVLTGAATVQGSFTFTVTVTDAANVTASKSFTIGIAPPLLTITTGSLPDGAGQTAYSATVSATGGVPPYHWSVSGLPTVFAIDSATGVISGTPGPKGTFPFTVTVTDSAGGANSKAFTINVTIAPLQITSAALPDAIAAIPYTAKLTASGGVLPYTWSIVGAIPQGFSLSSDGTISGTDPKAEVLSFPVRVVDGQGTIAAALVGLRVAPAPLVITPATLPGGTAGLAYSQTLSATGGVPPFTWTATLPAGLKIDANTGAISGASLAGGPQALVVTVTDAAGTIAQKSYPVTFAAPPLPGITVGVVQAVPATQPNFNFSLASPYPLPITGTATLSFKPDGTVTDPAVLFASGKSTLPFTVAANAVSPTFTAGTNGFQTGTLAGTITITLSLQSGGLDVTPSPAPSTQIRIAPQAPVISSVTATRSAGVLTVTVQGFSDTREVSQAFFHLNGVVGATLSPTDITLPASALFLTYFQGSSSATMGGQFLYTQQFTATTGSLTQILSVGVSLANSVGASNSLVATAQ